MCLFLLMILAFTSCTPPKTGSTGVVDDLRCEYLRDPLGIDVIKPRLSWKMNKEVNGAKQTAYRITVASDDELLIHNTKKCSILCYFFFQPTKNEAIYKNKIF